MDKNKNEMLEAALKYAGQGWAVFPLKPRGKAPVTTNGVKDATTDYEQVKTWWNKYPKANIGIATGQKSGGLVIVDLDVKETGVNGLDSLKDWERENGNLPDTVQSMTGSGGYHIFFHSEKIVKNAVGLLDGVDIRADGGYIVAPPSIHQTGNRYEWEYDPDEYDIADADENLYKLLSLKKKERKPTYVLPDKVDEGGRNDTIFRLAASLQSNGLSDEAIMASCNLENEKRCNPPLTPEEVETCVASALHYDKGELMKIRPRKKDNIILDVNKDGKVKQTIENFATVMRQDEELSGKIRYDAFAYAPKYFGVLPWKSEKDNMGDWTDADDSNLRAYIESNYSLSNKDKYENGLGIVLDENRFNPVVDFLEALPKWDGVNRIETLLPRFLGAEKDEYTTEVMKLFMLGAINRAYHPGCKFDYMLVLVGAQGIGKSTFLQELSLQPNWFDDNFNTIEGNIAIERLRGKWILEMAELLAIRRTKDVEAIKAFVTTRADNYREPYARRTQQRPRRCVFAATTNDYNFLTDRTGNRRFLPVECRTEHVTDSLFSKGVAEYFTLAWSEALHIFKGENPRLVLPKSLQDTAIQKQMTFLEEDPWVGMIQHYLDHTPKERICVMDLWREALDRDRDEPKRPETNRMHTIMKNEISGWHTVGKQRCDDYGIQRAYERDPFTDVPDEEQVPF